MNDLPPWFSIAVVGLFTALGAAFAALWHGLWPGAAPNLFAFAALCLLIAFFAINDTFRAMTRQPMDPSVALVEVVVGGAALFALTQRVLPFVIAVAFCVLLRSEAGRLTGLIVTLYDRPSAELARRLRRRFSGLALGAGMGMVLCGLGSNLETSTSLLHWGFGPIAVVAGGCALILVSGAEYEVMRTRFRGGEVTADASFGVGWWGPVAGLIAAVIIVAAIAPPLPSFITLHQVGTAVLNVAQHTTRNTGPQNLGPASTTATHAKGPAKIGPIPRSELGLFLFLLLVLVFVAVEIVRALLVMKRLGVGGWGLLQEYWGRARIIGEQAGVFFVGLYALVQEGLRGGDWRGLQRLLRRWWQQLLAALTGMLRRNVWHTLVARSAGHRQGADFAAQAGPRTAAGAAWRLPPGDPRRRIREMYREFMQRAGEVGLARRPHQSPATFGRMVVGEEPAAGDGVTQLTTSYEWARFSVREVSEDQVSSATRGWGVVGAVLGRRREVPAGQAGQGGTPPPGAGGRHARPPAPGEAAPKGAAAPGFTAPGQERQVTLKDTARRRGR